MKIMITNLQGEEEIVDANVVTLAVGDVIDVNFKEGIKAEHAEQMIRKIAETFPDNKVLGHYDNIEITIIKNTKDDNNEVI